MMNESIPWRLLLVLLVTFSATSVSHAQLKGTHLLGDLGLQAATLPAPSFAPSIALYDYHATKFVKADGTKIDVPNVNSFVFGFGANVVTNFKILGGNYGASVLLALASGRVEGNLVSTRSSLAFSDSYIEPLQLGWTTKHADFSCGYGLYIPTGKYSLEGSSNAGLGMWTNEFSCGSTVYFDPKKNWNFSTLFSYALNSAKKNTGDNTITVGNLLIAEGGAGKTWYRKAKNNPLPIVINAGLVYYMQLKTTDDKMDIPSLSGSIVDLHGKDRVFGLGAEGNIFIPGIRSSISLRWLTEVGAHNRTEGNSFIITIAPGIHFFKTGK